MNTSIRSLKSLMSRTSSHSSHEVLDSEQVVASKAQVPQLKTPFEQERLRNRLTGELGASDLSNQYITLQSAQLGSLSESLIEINLANNLLHAIPMQIRNCSQIRLLNLSNNQVTQIPPYLCTLPLETLIMNDNLIKSVPSTIAKLESLVALMLNNNNIEILSPELFTLRLVRLGLRSNTFISIPATFLQALQTLKQFDLDWLDQCGVSCMFDVQSKEILINLAQRAFQRKELITFGQMYFFFKNQVLDITKLNLRKQNILFDFVTKDSIGLIKQTCMKNPELCHTHDCEGYTPLTYAFNLRKGRCIQALLNYYQSKSDEIHILMFLAIKRLDVQTLRLLIQTGINPNFQNRNEITGMGLTHKQSIPVGSTAMHIAMTSFGRNVSQQAQAATIVKILLECGCDPNITNQDKMTSLHAAVKLPSLAAVRYASTQKEFDFQKRGEQCKNSPMHTAASMGLVSILQLIQSQNADPFAINVYNKTPKQVSIASLQIIKLIRKYENHYYRHKVFCVNEEDRNKQKNQNLMQIGENFTVLKPSEVTSPNKNHRRVFRLNLSQVRQQNDSQSSSRGGLSSQRGTNPELNNLFGEVCQIVRQQQSLKQVLPKITILYKNSETLSQRLIVCSILCLIIMRARLQLKYQSQIASSSLQIINQTKFQDISSVQFEDVQYSMDRQQLNQYKQYSQSVKVPHLLKENNEYTTILRQDLSMSLKYNISNTWEETFQEYEQMYNDSQGNVGWCNAIRCLRLKNTDNYCKSNRSILFDYEQMQNRMSTNTRFIRTQQRHLDVYKQDKVDNSESQGNLSDRMGRFKGLSIQTKKSLLCMPSRSVGKSESIISSSQSRQSSSVSSRKISVQIRQLSGERGQTFIKWDSCSQTSLLRGSQHK